MKQSQKISPHLPDLPGQEGCIFCKIVHGDIPCAKLYETDNFLAFLDINPFRQGHTLVMPKVHCPTAFELPPALGAELVETLQKVGRAIVLHTQAHGLNCLQNNYPAAGQVIFHAHWHLIPRHDGDGLFSDPKLRASYAPSSIEDFAAQLRMLI